MFFFSVVLSHKTLNQRNLSHLKRQKCYFCESVFCKCIRFGLFRLWETTASPSLCLFFDEVPYKVFRSGEKRAEENAVNCLSEARLCVFVCVSMQVTARCRG